jgi:hypothetical protein
MSNKPVDAGPGWDELETLDLNRHRADPRENMERAKVKADWCMENPGFSDSRARERSATATMVNHFLTLLPDAELGRKTIDNLKSGRGKRLGYKSPLRNAIEVVCVEIESRDPAEVLAALDNVELIRELYNAGLIDVLTQELSNGRFYYVQRDGKEKDVLIKTLKNILSAL